MEKLIITACITGAEVTRQQQPALAITPDEIARDAYDLFLQELQGNNESNCQVKSARSNRSANGF